MQRRFYCDMFFPQQRVAIEFDGGYHSDNQQRMDDNLRELILDKAGIRIVRIDSQQMMIPSAMDLAATRIAKLIGWRMRKPSDATLQAREKLRSIILDWHRNLYSL